MNEALWTRVQSALDERRDPLADEAVRAALLEHPDDALKVCALRSALGELERADFPLVLPRRSRFVPLVGAAALLLALGTWYAFAPRRTAFEELALHPVLPAPQFGSVRSWEFVTTLETPESTRTLYASSQGVASEEQYLARSGDSTGALARAAVLSTHEESWSLP